MIISCFEDLAAEAKQLRRKTTVAVVEAQDEHTLESVVKAVDDDIITPLLIGDSDKIKKILDDVGANASKHAIIHSTGAHESLKRAADLIKAGAVSAIMKGGLESGDFIKALLKREYDLLEEETISLAGLFMPPKYHKMFAVSDMGVIMRPNLK